MKQLKAISLSFGIILAIGCSSCQDLTQILDPGTQTENTGGDTPVDTQEPIPASLSSYKDAEHVLSALGTAYSDIPYSKHTENEYDLILPKYANGKPVPVVIFFHGGGFVQGNKNSLYKKTSLMKEMEAYLNAGIAVVNANYRLLGVNETEGVLKCLEDAEYLVQRIKYESPSNGINSEKIVLRGTSAGASISLWLALHDDMADPDNSDPIRRESTRVAGAVAENAQSTLDVTKWEDVFQTYAYRYDQGLDEEMKARLYGIYGLKAPIGPVNREKFESDTKEYRQKVDFAAFMDAGDPPILVANKPNLDGPPTEKNLLFHHREHAHYLEKQSQKVGGGFNKTNVFHYTIDPTVKELIDFTENLVR